MTWKTIELGTGDSESIVEAGTIEDLADGSIPAVVFRKVISPKDCIAIINRLVERDLLLIQLMAFLKDFALQVSRKGTIGKGIQIKHFRHGGVRPMAITRYGSTSVLASDTGDRTARRF